MSASWLAVHLVEAPERLVLVNASKIAAIGADPEGGARIVLTNSRGFDVIENLEALEARLSQAGR